jgi:acetoin utilization protein AcuB
MTRGLATVGPQDTLAEAVEILERYAVRHLPVVRGDALVGMISERDIARARGRNAADDVQIDQHMSEHVVTAEAGAPLSTAAALMIEHRISSLSVVESGALVGIVTMTDLLDHCMNLFRDAREYDVTSPAKEPQ